MRLTILGGGAAWPTARRACGGYLVEHDGYTLLIDPGFAVLPQLLALRPVAGIDAVLVSHGHLDHCADLPAVLGARLAGGATTALPVLAPRGALVDLLRAARSRAAVRSAALDPLRDGDTRTLGPFSLEVGLLPHHVSNAGFRLRAGDHVLAYTGDSGECQERISLAKGADLLLAEATFATQVPAAERRFLSSAVQAAQLALTAEVEHTILTHHLPAQRVEPWLAAAREEGLSSVLAASAGMSVDLDGERSPWARRAAEEVARPRPLAVLPRRARDRP